MPPQQRGAPDLLDADISFSLDRLFDHYNMDHIPEEKRLDSFKKRDLGHVKSYKAAVKIFGGPLSRKRVIYAPPMETPLKHRLGLYLGKATPPSSPNLNSELNRQALPARESTAEEVVAQREQERLEDYQKWISNRKKLRINLNSLGLNEQWLKGKPELSELEARVISQMRAEKDIEMPKEPVQRKESLKEVPPVPTLHIPSPYGLQIIDQHLVKKKLRLLDLFRSVDKDKNWAISKEEFANCIKEADLDITDKELEDLVISLDQDLNDEVDYAELAKGMLVWKRERREKKQISMSQKSDGSSSIRSLAASPETSRAGRSQSSSSKHSERASSKGDTVPSELGRDDGASSVVDRPFFEVNERTRSSEGRPTSMKSSKSSEISTKGRSSSIQYLEAPASDLRLEQMIQNSEEAMVDLRKHDRAVLSRARAVRKASPNKTGERSVIKTGNRAIDNHCLPSTLGGEMAEMVDEFRQKRLKEYYDVVHLCETKEVPLTRQLLERVLLYPPEQPKDQINLKIMQPGGAGSTLMSSRFMSNRLKSTSPKPRQHHEIHHKDRVRQRTKSGKDLIDSHHIYPRALSKTPSVHKEYLSTGRALISRKVDCWMTFEEFENLTQNLAVRYKHLHGGANENAFWPGHLLDKLRLCMPDHVPFGDRSHAIFYNSHQPTRSNPGYHNDLNTWPVGPEGHVTYASHERHYKNL